MFSYCIAGILFLTYATIDVLYASYIISVTDQKPFKAAVYSMLIYTLLAFGVISYSSNLFYLIPIAMGSGVGTFLTVWWAKRKGRKTSSFMQID